MATSYREDKEFLESVIISNISNALEQAIEWIAKNKNPEDVFNVIDLEQWAESNGYVKED